RNLKELTGEGRILEITTTKGPSRYDANISRHSHLRCMGCEKLEDVAERNLPTLISTRRLQRYRILEYRIELLGLCPKCQSKKELIIKSSRRKYGPERNQDTRKS